MFSNKENSFEFIPTNTTSFEGIVNSFINGLNKKVINFKFLAQLIYFYDQNKV